MMPAKQAKTTVQRPQTGIQTGCATGRDVPCPRRSVGTPAFLRLPQHRPVLRRLPRCQETGAAVVMKNTPSFLPRGNMLLVTTPGSS